METDVQWMILTIYVWIEREKERMHTTPGGHAYEARGHGAEGGAASTCRCGRLPAGERARRLPPHNWAARALAEVYNRHDNRLRRCERRPAQPREQAAAIVEVSASVCVRGAWIWTGRPGRGQIPDRFRQIWARFTANLSNFARILILPEFAQF